MSQDPWPEQVKMDHFLLFGDSLTQMSYDCSRGFAFGAQLANDYIRRLDVVNRGFSGYNSAQALHILPSIIPHPSVAKIRLMTIFLGANDACLQGYETKQHIPLEEYKRNIASIINHPSVKAHSPRIILITPPPVDEHQFLAIARGEGKEEIGRTAVHTKSYADACGEVGTQQKVAVLDLWSVMIKAAGWDGGPTLPGSLAAEPNETLKEYLGDGLHFFPSGYRVLYDALTRLIAEKWPDQVPDPETMPMVLPRWEVAPPRPE